MKKVISFLIEEPDGSVAPVTITVEAESNESVDSVAELIINTLSTTISEE